MPDLIPSDSLPSASALLLTVTAVFLISLVLLVELIHRQTRQSRRGRPARQLSQGLPSGMAGLLRPLAATALASRMADLASAGRKWVEGHGGLVSRDRADD